MKNKRVVWLTPMNGFETQEVMTVLVDKGDRLIVTSSFHDEWQYKPRTVVVTAQVKVLEE